MIPLTTLCIEYIDRRKLSEQEKNPIEYIVPVGLDQIFKYRGRLGYISIWTG